MSDSGASWTTTTTTSFSATSAISAASSTTSATPSISTPSTPITPTTPSINANANPNPNGIANTTTKASTRITPIRRPYRGSCHCGAIRYIAHLSFPRDSVHSPAHSYETIYRCNCTVCHKAGFLHARLDDAPEDFLLLSPEDPYRDLADYQCDAKQLHFFFCRTCGTRPFIFMGEGERVDVDLAELGLGEEGKVRAWRPKKSGWDESERRHGCYLSINANTLEPGQEGLDLREWHEKKWLAYLDNLSDDQDERPSRKRPHPGGVY